MRFGTTGKNLNHFPGRAAVVRGDELGLVEADEADDLNAAAVIHAAGGGGSGSHGGPAATGQAHGEVVARHADRGHPEKGNGVNIKAQKVQGCASGLKK